MQCFPERVATGSVGVLAAAADFAADLSHSTSVSSQSGSVAAPPPVLPSRATTMVALINGAAVLALPSWSSSRQCNAYNTGHQR
jgi:hypothetical protein